MVQRRTGRQPLLPGGLYFGPGNDGVTQVFESKLYFPIDERGFGNSTTTAKTAEQISALPPSFTRSSSTKAASSSRSRATTTSGAHRQEAGHRLGGIHSASQPARSCWTSRSGPWPSRRAGHSLDIFDAERHRPDPIKSRRR